MSTLLLVPPIATMEEAWAESARLWGEADRLQEACGQNPRQRKEEMDRTWAERARLRSESTLWVILTAQAIYGKDVQIDWLLHTARPFRRQGQNEWLRRAKVVISKVTGKE